MKAELNYSLRLRFFGQYLNSCDCGDHGESFRVPWDSRSISSLLEAEQEQAFLYLRPLSQITDEEAIQVAKCAGEIVFVDAGQKLYFTIERSRNLITVKEKYHSEYVVIDSGDGQVLTYDDDLTASVNSIWGYQKMVSMGFAIPFMGNTVEEMVEAGWIKLTTPPLH